MAYIALLLIVLGLSLKIVPRDQYSDWFDLFVRLVITGIIVTPINMTIKYLVLKPYVVSKNVTRVLREIPLYSLQGPSMSTSGLFVLGFGSIHSTPVFFAYTKKRDGAFRLVTIPATDTDIYEDASVEEPPRYVRSVAEPSCSKNNSRARPEWTTILYPVACWVTYGIQSGKLHIPPGSIQTRYTL